MKKVEEFSWSGSQELLLDERRVDHVGCVSIGRYGGTTSVGSHKNEDACLVWTNSDWEFAILLDAHKSDESARLVVDTFEEQKYNFHLLFEKSTSEAFQKVEPMILNVFQNPSFIEKCRRINGSTACLIAFRKAQYVYWFSVGDNMLFLLHPELEALHQLELNQRNFYEWIGEVNTFDLSVPCFSSGTRELRTGINTVVLATDGLTECPNTKYEQPQAIWNTFMNTEDPLRELLIDVEQNNGTDSATIITWTVENDEEARWPCDLPKVKSSKE